MDEDFVRPRGQPDSASFFVMPNPPLARPAHWTTESSFFSDKPYRIEGSRISLFTIVKTALIVWAIGLFAFTLYVVFAAGSAH